MLFEVVADPGELLDQAQERPAVVRDLASRYDAWWASVRGSLINEHVQGPAANPIKELYWRQFGGGPSAEDLKLMDLELNPATRR
jgi:arylsulfatase